jgi:hypothetical protein
VDALTGDRRAAEDVSGSADFVWSRAAASFDYLAPEAFLTLVSLAAAVDGTMGALESLALQHLTHRWWKRGVVQERDVTALNFAVCDRLSVGAERALAQAAEALPVQYRQAVFAQALDIMLCDGPLKANEGDFAARLAGALRLGEEDGRRIRDVIALKNAF